MVFRCRTYHSDSEGNSFIAATLTDATCLVNKVAYI